MCVNPHHLPGAQERSPRERWAVRLLVGGSVFLCGALFFTLYLVGAIWVEENAEAIARGLARAFGAQP